ncbi:expressed protein [Dictyostelium purpureum]|uniref:Expressed protein n=1 Tax=Dictyostelium purpureum TaxID=5786 RepID=F0ZV14_DICPU|nr:uncharacterized protein DICPUDRAFT_81936 [Dictyostelium purpureum]EGC32227.1 expressed protein [Dictyostelium purpureum]|eukprot:XP_003291263.1 expressed protein [Dictyostelium purpureum]
MYKARIAKMEEQYKKKINSISLQMERRRKKKCEICKNKVMDLKKHYTSLKHTNNLNKIKEQYISSEGMESDDLEKKKDNSGCFDSSEFNTFDEIESDEEFENNEENENIEEEFEMEPDEENENIEDINEGLNLDDNDIILLNGKNHRK